MLLCYSNFHHHSYYNNHLWGNNCCKIVQDCQGKKNPEHPVGKQTSQRKVKLLPKASCKMICILKISVSSPALTYTKTAWHKTKWSKPISPATHFACLKESPMWLFHQGNQPKWNSHFHLSKKRNSRCTGRLRIHRTKEVIRLFFLILYCDNPCIFWLDLPGPQHAFWK